MNNPYQAPSSELSSVKKHESIKEIVVYWEKKRLLYNLVLLVVGLTTLILSKSIAITPPFALIIGIPFYGIGANLMYTLGPYLNICAVLIYGNSVATWNSIFYMGLLFSICLTVAIGSVPIVALTPF